MVPVSVQVNHFLLIITLISFADESKAYVRSQLCGLKPGKVVGLDTFPARLFIDSADIVAKPLTSIINMSLKFGVVPLERKGADVIPMFKKGKSYGQLSSYLDFVCRQGCQCTSSIICLAPVPQRTQPTSMRFRKVSLHGVGRYVF